MENFRVDIPKIVLDDLRTRLSQTRWPDQVRDAGWDYGTELSFLKGLFDYWLNEFDWRKQEEILNRYPQFLAEINGLKIHFVYVRGKGPNPLPLVISHGWPSSVFESYKIIEPLTDPQAHGGGPADSFDVIVPSLPGFGFSERPSARGFIRVDNLWRVLMTEILSYRRFVAHGTDVGARVTSALGRFHSDVVSAIHIASVDLGWPDPLPDDLSPAEHDYIARVEAWEKRDGAYGEIQSTRPQTLAYGLNDSPAGLAAWIFEKYREWSDCNGDIETRFTKDELLTNITIYWVTQTINSSMRRYFEARHNPNPHPLRPGERIETPAGIAMFPGEKDLLVPREFAERCYNIQHWTDMPRGGHFPALEEPGLLVEDIRTFFRKYRK
ncbi:MAG: epoxide hydrolase [Anaerolineales bacterium]|nr:epoxide hydrolase [Anaerolineales bacterium]